HWSAVPGRSPAPPERAGGWGRGPTGSGLGARFTAGRRVPEGCRCGCRPIERAGVRSGRGGQEAGRRTNQVLRALGVRKKRRWMELLWAVAGWVVGIGLNAVVYELPRSHRLFARPHCAECESQLPWAALTIVVPRPRGGCRNCQTRAVDPAHTLEW